MAPYEGNPTAYTAAPLVQPFVSEPMMVRDLLRLRALLSDPKVWAHGKAYEPPAEPQFCLLSGAGHIEARSNIERALCQVLGTEDEDAIWVFNDTHTHAEVLALIDTALSRARQERPNG